jgi:hypothetical protein
MLPPWEFNADLDTPKSYQGFCAYRDLGPMRSLEGAYQVYRHQDGIKTVPGFFREWSWKGQWVDRVHAFDLEHDRIRLEKMQGEARSDHESRIERIRAMVEGMAIIRLSTSLRTAEIVRDTIARLYDDSAVKVEEQTRHVLNHEQAEFLATLISIQAKDSGTIESSLKLADEALNIQGVMDKLNQD